MEALHLKISTHTVFLEPSTRISLDLLSTNLVKLESS